jgi:two-component system, chemotaxis family, response regulator PixG
MTGASKMILKTRQIAFLSIKDLLEDFAVRCANGYLKVSANDVDWFVYFKDGQIFYVNFSITPLNRLELYGYQRLQRHKKSIDRNVFETLRQQTSILKLDDYYPSYDYQALYSLVKSRQLSFADATIIAQEVSKESMRSFLLLKDYEHEFVSEKRQFPILWMTDTTAFIKECKSEIYDWQMLGRNFHSPYLRPFLLDGDEGNSKYDYLRKFLIGGDFHQLSLYLNQSAIRIAQNLAPMVKEGVVGLRAPQMQYAKMPRFWQDDSDPTNPSFSIFKTAKYKIVCVDDSPTILRRIHDFLDETDFEIIAVQDSRMALSKIIAVKPNIILTDVDMPHLDGYQLCKMLRRNSQLKKTPIIMVTSNQGWVNRTKASLCGVNNYITKPFTQSNLNEVVFQHLTF